MSDLISRSALLKEVKSLTVTVTGLRAGKGVLHEYAKQYKNTLLRIINEQPTIEAVPVVEAEWEVNGVNPHNMTIGNWRCTACDGISLKNSNFCLHCGAMMKGSVK